jgi:hypothetical protein
MKKLETILSGKTQALLVEGETVAATGWRLDDTEVVLVDKEGSVLAAGPLGPLGANILPNIQDIDVFAISPQGINEMKRLPRK